LIREKEFGEREGNGIWRRIGRRKGNLERERRIGREVGS
jgi:hypothetical protein